MDRLSSLVKWSACAFAASVLACGTEKSEAPPPPSRVVAVKAKEKKEEPASDFCDVETRTGGRVLLLPELDAPYVAAAGAARWVNVWATWCKPCIKEMPMLAAWQAKMAAEGLKVQLDFLSVDEDKEALSAFVKENPYIKNPLHLKNPDALGPWLAALGLDEGAGLPIHIFTDSRGAIRCVRAAAINEDHYAAISALLR